MVRFSSNLKRPKVVAKQNAPLLSKEAPVHASKISQIQGLHSHTRSLPNSHHVSSITVHEIGLSTEHAVRKLIEEIDRVLHLKRLKHSSSRIKLTSFLRYATLLVLTILPLRWSNSSFQMGLFCGLILISELIFIELIERKRMKSSVPDSMKEIRNKLRRIDKKLLANEANDLESLYTTMFKVPLSSATSYTRVIRNGKVRLICLNLIVPGDFVVLLAGEKASHLPVPCQAVNLLIPSHQKRNLGLPPDSSVVLIEEFPVRQVFEDQLKSPRRSRFIFAMLQEKLQLILSFGLLATCALWTNSASKPQILIQLPKPIVIPLILLSSPLLRFFWWLSSTCYISLLADQLINSETPFNETVPSDTQDVDEFDEDAPPPVKNIKIPMWRVAIEVLNRLFCTGNRSCGILRLWDGDVIEALALTSVLCFTDREGPISNSHSRPCELIVPTLNESELTAIELIPTISDSQLVRPTLNNNSEIQAFDLRAIGLAMLLSTECGRPESLKPHCRHRNVLGELCHNLPEHLQSNPQSMELLSHCLSFVACYCNLSKEIGFDPSILNRFRQIKTIWNQHSHQITTGHGVKHKKTSSVSILVEDQLSTGIVYDNNEAPSGHLFTFGEASDILKHCATAFAKDFAQNSKVAELSESLKMKLLDFEGTMRSCDVSCVAFSYRPIFEDEPPTIIPNQQVFLGLISVCPEPKQHFQEFIDDLEAAGVRFAYFSPYREQPSKAFGERLGLETDWNSCILLSEHPNPSSQSPGYSALSDIKARLPRGIRAIRPHLESVDDIPLHVSIFAECNGHNSAEMMKIYQESGEIVSVIGSCRSVRNSKCFGTAHLAIGADPLYNSSGGSRDTPITFDTLALDINSNSVKMILPADSSPYIITELIRESRTLLQNSINAWEFLCGSLSCFILVGGIPSYNTFIVTVSVFVMAISLALGSHDSLVMKTHSTVLDSSKCPESIPFSFLVSCALLTVVRFLPSLAGIALIKLIFSSNSARSLGMAIVLLSQAFPFAHAYERRHDLYKNLTVPFVLSIFVLLSSLYLCHPFSNLISLTSSILISGVFAVLSVTWHEMIKSVHLKDHYEQAQKRAKLLFNTKLGMHSPI